MEFHFIPHTPQQFSPEESLSRSQEFFEFMDQRRSVRELSDRPVPLEVMENLIRTASTAPSGAHKQPWTFCLVGDPEIKRQIRVAAEEEERLSYEGRMSEEWLQDLAPLGTDWRKPFLEIAPWLVVCFKQNYGLDSAGNKRKHYYVNDSVGLACGFFLAAVHHVGLVSLTHTPSPMDFLTKILNRPENERPFLLMPVGYPAENATVPDLTRKPLDAVMVKY